MISDDEDNHLAYCHEELLRLAAAGHADFIHRTLRAMAIAEIGIYRDVSESVMAHLGRILRWPRPKSAALAGGIHAARRSWTRQQNLTSPRRTPWPNKAAQPSAATPGRGADSCSDRR